MFVFMRSTLKAHSNFAETILPPEGMLRILTGTDVIPTVDAAHISYVCVRIMSNYVKHKLLHSHSPS